MSDAELVAAFIDPGRRRLSLLEAEHVVAARKVLS